MTRQVLIVIGIAVVLVAGVGMYGIVVTLSNSTPARMSLLEYMATSNSSKWLELTDCHFVADEAMGTYTEGTPAILVQNYDDIYVPLAPSEDFDGPFKVVLKVRDANLKRRLEDSMGLGFGSVPEVGAQTVRGTIQFGVEGWFGDADLIRSQGDLRLADDWVILEQLKEPSLGVYVLILIGAAFVGLFTTLQYARDERRRRAHEERLERRRARARPAPPDQPPPLPRP